MSLNWCFYDFSLIPEHCGRGFKLHLPTRVLTFRSKVFHEDRKNLLPKKQQNFECPMKILHTLLDKMTPGFLKPQPNRQGTAATRPRQD
ncbi:hypothetical protein AgCh_039000 [Apium graveolens]